MCAASTEYTDDCSILPQIGVLPDCLGPVEWLDLCMGVGSGILGVAFWTVWVGELVQLGWNLKCPHHWRRARYIEVFPLQSQ